MNFIIALSADEPPVVSARTGPQRKHLRSYYNSSFLCVI